MDQICPKNVLPIQTRTNKHRRWIQHIRISLDIKCHLKQHFWFFKPNLSNNVFPVQNRTNLHHHRTQHIQISLSIKCHLNQTILIFWTTFALKAYFWSKTGKVNVTIEFSIFELIQIPTFIMSREFWCFGITMVCPKRELPYALPSNSAYLSYSRYIVLSLTDNFDFWMKIAQNEYFRSKPWKVNNTITEFSIFELS